VPVDGQRIPGSGIIIGYSGLEALDAPSPAKVTIELVK
jgi:hypothetical protein